MIPLNSTRRLAILSVIVVLLGPTIAVGQDAKCNAETDDPSATGDPSKVGAWNSLFDGKSLKGWVRTNFGGEGDVYVEDGCLMLDFGSSMTGVTLDTKQPAAKNLPVSNYELRLEAKRLEGNDFFCGLTFPVGDAHCSLIVGGWGGALVGLSSVDGNDAARNETQLSMPIKRDQWYAIRLSVQDDRITVWIDKKKVIDLPTNGRILSIRPEVELCRPLGFCTWETRAALRNIQLRQLH